jgi:hypothetical protein
MQAELAASQAVLVHVDGLFVDGQPGQSYPEFGMKLQFGLVLFFCFPHFQVFKAFLDQVFAF